MSETATLFDRVVAALHAVGLQPKIDADLENVTFDTDGPQTVGVVMNHYHAVVFYAVWPEQVPEEALSRVAEFVVRANTDLYTSALELDLNKQILSARSAVDCSALDDVDETSFGAMLRAALDEARRVSVAHHDGLAAIVAGGKVFDGLSKRHG